MFYSVQAAGSAVPAACAALAIGYALGCLSLAQRLGRRKGVDMTASGTGALGASNTVLHLGAGWGVLVALHDIAKAAIAVLLTRLLFSSADWLPYLAGLSAVLGHIYPIQLGFHGGKGFACFVGFLLAADWRAAVFIIPMAAAAALVFDIITAATFTCVIAYPLYLLLYKGDPAVFVLTAAASALIIVKHRANIKNIMAHKEQSLRAALFKKAGKDRQTFGEGDKPE